VFGGFYKSVFRINGGAGRSVTYVQGGKLLGGNSGFAHIGSYREIDGKVHAEITSRRHTEDPKYPSLLGSPVSTIEATGQPDGATYHFVGSSPQLPNAAIHAVMTPLEEQALPPPGIVCDGGIGNGLYSIHLKMLDGLVGGFSGVMLLNDGRILGGDAFFYYLGSYASANGRWRGEILNQEHTPAEGEHPIFGGHDVGIGFAGTCGQEGAELEGTALAGKRSVRFQAVLKLMSKA
jgi:hypothetical protein